MLYRELGLDEMRGAKRKETLTAGSFPEAVAGAKLGYMMKGIDAVVRGE